MGVVLDVVVSVDWPWAAKSRGDRGDGLGRRLTPFGGRGVCVSKRLFTGDWAFGEDGESSEAEGEAMRREEIGMRDLECELSRYVREPSCKGAETAMSESGGCKLAPSGKFPGISLLVRRW
jgi:hypothetical protein